MSEVPDGFRDTPLGPLPETWDVVKVGDVISEMISGDWGGGDKDGHEAWIRCQVIRGTDFPSVAAGEFFGVPERFLRPSSVEKRRLRVDDMLVEISGGSKYQPTGRILCITPRISSSARLPLLFTNFVKLFRIDQSSVAPSFFHLVWGYLYELGRTRIYEKRTTGIRNFKYGDFVASEYIPLPPLAEQRAIAHVLRTVQQAREATDRVIAAVRELKRSLMRHLFTYGPVPVHEAERVELREAEIGPIPVDWEVVVLGQVIKGTQYGTSSRAESTGKYPMLRMNNLVDGRIDARDLKYIDLDDDEFAKFKVNRGDVLFNRTNSFELVGKTSIFDLEEDYVFASYLVRIIADGRKLHPSYLNYFLNWQSAQDRLKQLATRGVSQSNISATKLRGFNIGLPSLSEQREIARILSTVDAKIEAEEARREALDGLFHSLLHHLMTGRIRAQGFQRQDAKMPRRGDAKKKKLGGFAS